MHKFLSFIFGAIYMLGYVANTLLFLYIWWGYITKSFINFINPLVWLGVVFDMLTMPLFWFFVGITVIGWFVSSHLNKQESESIIS